ncbi:hypothetical protein EXN66_Car008551 [Channa argus]|uniref:Uncharacterized protein n=1 Tax=Channa argus TaxID=215402 RepID=A0A6G1PRG5_CHAAH|nr:hypothetical protein EXN66_Car008551 [Channa argus]
MLSFVIMEMHILHRALSYRGRRGGVEAERGGDKMRKNKRKVRGGSWGKGKTME